VSAYTLAEEFTDLTSQMDALKLAHRARRAELRAELAEQLAEMREEERALAARRARVALKMSRSGERFEDLGRMTGVSGPFLCQLARRAREENE
jgi:cell division protein FtsB